MSKTQKYSSFTQFLRKHKTIPEKPFTHTSIPGPNVYPGSYCINDDELDEFYKLYNKHVFENKQPAHLTERHKDVSPILIDLDFRHKPTDNSRKYDKTFIENFLKIYFGEIEKLLGTVIEKKNMVAYVLEKKKPVMQQSKNILKDGIHIIMPFIVTHPKIQYVLRYNTITNDEIKSLCENINVTNTLEDIFDIAVIERNNWQMYGSCKPENQSYELTSILRYNKGSFSDDKIDSNKSNYVKFLSIRSFDNKYSIDTTSIDEIIEEQFEKIPKKQQVKKQKKTAKRKKATVRNYLDNDADIDFIKSIVAILNPARADNYEDWIRLGWCLHNIDYRLLETWVNFSKQSEKFVDGECEKEWDCMDNEGLGLGSLYRWASEDNLAKYNELSKDNLRKCMLDSLSQTPNDVARVVHHMYKHEFVCAGVKKNLWYRFRNHRWIELDDAIDLSKKLSDTKPGGLIYEYLNLNQYISSKVCDINCTMSNKQKQYEMENLKTISAIITKLKITSFKKNVITECKELFHDSKFEEKLDSNINLLGFDNGIYDLETCTFRDGLPEDYITYTTGNNYYDFDDEDDRLSEVRTFLTQVLPKDNIREYIMTVFGSCVTGKTYEKFFIFTGKGGNGKSKLVELLENSLGNYSCTLPVTLMTQKRARAEAADPVLASLPGKRFGCMQEPDKNEEIHVGFMKQLTGGDKLKARKLHKDPIEFKPQIKVFMCCNVLPQVSDNDDGTWRRIRVIEFISSFVDEPNPNIKHQFKIDTSLGDKIKVDGPWVEPFIYLVLEYYKKYKKFGIKEPSAVKKCTQEYKSESDLFSQFISEKIITTDNPTSAPLRLADIYFIFQEWIRQTRGHNTKVPSRQELTNNMNKHFGDKSSSDNKNVWSGIAIKNGSDLLI